MLSLSQLVSAKGQLPHCNKWACGPSFVKMVLTNHSPLSRLQIALVQPMNMSLLKISK